MFQWSVATNKFTYYGKNDKAILKDYLRWYHDYYQYDQFDSSFELLPDITGINLGQVSD